MRKINILEAEAHLSRLTDKAAAERRRLVGILDGRMRFPDDRAAFKAVGKDEIELMLGGDDD